MTNTQLEVTVKAVLSAVEGDIERLPTDQEFFAAFDGMADKLYDIDGLVDPALWGQASNGQIELLLCFPQLRRRPGGGRSGHERGPRGQRSRRRRP